MTVGLGHRELLFRETELRLFLEVSQEASTGEASLCLDWHSSCQKGYRWRELFHGLICEPLDGKWVKEKRNLRTGRIIFWSLQSVEENLQPLLLFPLSVEC